MFLENVYGTLFSPGETFERLKQNTNLITGLLVVILISAIKPLLNITSISAIMSFGVMSAMFFGIIKWFVFAFFIEMIACAFQKGGRIESFLTLSAFALLPWMFLAPVALFKTGGILTGLLGVFVGIGLWIWATILILFAIVRAYEISSERVLLLIVAPLLGGLIALDWIVGFFTTLGGIIGV